MYEMILAVSSILKKFHISTTDDIIKVNPLITLKPVDVQLKFTLRDS